MDFARRFEDYQVERIRRAILDYRTKFDVGDVTLTKEILRYLPAAVTYDSTLKNVQRLRRGERMRGPAFLNACIQFLEIQMINPPEEELGLAMKRFVGDIFGFADLWPEVGGNYALRVLGERKPTAVEAFRSASAPRRGVPINLTQGKPAAQGWLMVLSIGQGDGQDYGIARERYYAVHDEAADEDEAPLSDSPWLHSKGVCLPIGGQDMLIMMRDFTFSHLYLLRREAFGYAGTMIIPSAYDFLTRDLPTGIGNSQYEVIFQQVPTEPVPAAENPATQDP